MLETMNKVIYKVGIYIRLSKEDEDRGYDDSESIINQKVLLQEYVEKLGPEYELVDIYIDQGFTGTNFNRPEFKRMIEDIKQKKVNMVVTKDLSRLGREYIETGEYVEKWFPENNVRYVSITDGIDTFEVNNGNNDIAPFKSILNDMYSKDLSKKIRTALHTMQAQGKWVGGKLAMGYKRDPNDKNKLVICEDEAYIVKMIFKMAYEGKNVGAIKNYLNENNIPTVHRSRYNQGTDWSSRTIKRMLVNPIYLGTSIQNRNSRISYKNRKLRPNPQEQWYIIEGTHEPIIEKKIFDAVQKMQITGQYTRNEKKNFVLLDGLMVCYECKHKMGIKKGRNDHMFMMCSYYRRFSKLKVCTAHGFNYDYFENAVLAYIKDLFVRVDSNKVELSMSKSNSIQDYAKMQDRIKKDIATIHEKMDKMYMDKLNNLINNEMYIRLSNKLQEDIETKEEKYNELENLKNNVSNDNVEDIKVMIKEFLKLEKPTPEFMKMIINKIEIHQNKQIDIVFNFKRLNEICANDSLIWT